MICTCDTFGNSHCQEMMLLRLQFSNSDCQERRLQVSHIRQQSLPGTDVADVTVSQPQLEGHKIAGVTHPTLAIVRKWCYKWYTFPNSACQEMKQSAPAVGIEMASQVWQKWWCKSHIFMCDTFRNNIIMFGLEHGFCCNYPFDCNVFLWC
jgi:hypothetical protein